MNFSKYHALGNDYIVINPKNIDNALNKTIIQKICDRNRGIGSNGILFGPITDNSETFELKIFNPDGSEAEISGNGLRIFVQFLKDNQHIKDRCIVETVSGKFNVTFDAHDNIIIEVGPILFPPSHSPFMINHHSFDYQKVNVGNPHCVIFNEKVTQESITQWGPTIENHPIFPNKTNVQFVSVINRDTIEIVIWERGAGYTLSSGSSSIAAASACYKKDLCDRHITVKMPGGNLDISFDSNFNALMKGNAQKVYDGQLPRSFFNE